MNDTERAKMTREDFIRVAESIGRRARAFVNSNEPGAEDALVLIDDTAKLLVDFFMREPL